MTETAAAAPPATDDGLSDYARTRSPDSFRRLVDRHLPLVYAAARRQVRDPALAEDVAQAVFLILADKAPSLRAGQPLAPWLLRVTHYAAANARRARARQAHHERKAAAMAAQLSTPDASRDESPWDEWSPLLDEGINRLNRRDRDAVVLRYLEQRSTREVAASLGISEPAAAKRVERAVAKLRDFFARRGATVSAAGLATTLAARSTEAAPVRLGTSIAQSAAGAASVAASPIAKGALIAMAYAKAKTVVVSVVVGALVVGGAGVLVVKGFGSGRSADARPAVAGGPVTRVPVTFSDGSTAEVVAVADNPDSGKWWAADGTPIPAPKEVPPNDRRLWMPPGTRAFYLCIRHEGPALAGTTLGVGLRQLHPADGNGDQAFGPNVRVTGYTVVVPNDLAAADLGLSLARGPWVVDERYTLPAGGPNSTAGVRNPTLGLRIVSEENGKVLVTLTRQRAAALGAGDEQLVVVSSADGKEYSSDSTTFRADGNAAVYRFPVPKAQAVALVHRWRPIEGREIRNISLRPGVRTDVTAVKPAH